MQQPPLIGIRKKVLKIMKRKDDNAERMVLNARFCDFIQSYHNNSTYIYYHFDVFKVQQQSLLSSLKSLDHLRSPC